MRKLLMEGYIFRNPDGTAKVWYVHYANGVMTTRWGRLGATLQENSKQCDGDEYRKTVRSKEGKGYESTGEETIGDEDGQTAGTPAQAQTAPVAPAAPKKFGGILYWVLDKKALSQPGWEKNVEDAFSGVEGVKFEQKPEAILVSAGTSKIILKPKASSISGTINAEDWAMALVIYRLSQVLPIDITDDNGETPSRNSLRSLFSNPPGFDELGEQLGLIPKITAAQRQTVDAFF